MWKFVASSNLGRSVEMHQDELQRSLTFEKKLALLTFMLDAQQSKDHLI